MKPKIFLETDYFIVGAGAMGLAFADQLIFNNKSDPAVEIVIVDKRAKPGGHWNDAYDFVRLHQPSHSYGVSSIPLGQGTRDLCSKYQLLAYFELALKKMMDTGRLKFLGQCEVTEDGCIQSLLDSELQYEVKARKKIVDASYLNTSIPFTNPPKYSIVPEVTLMPINGLTRVQRAWKKFVIIGAGKTGIDAVLYLLDIGVGEEKIVWIMPNDSWLFNRDFIYPENTEDYVNAFNNAFFGSLDFKDIILTHEKDGFFMRLDKSRWPTKFKCATVNPEEFGKLTKVKTIVRQGRVSEIQADKIVFKDGTTFPTSVDNLHVDCSSDGLAMKPPCPIFQEKKIVLQSVQMCQQVMSASFIAGVEMLVEDNDEKKNSILTLVPHPEFIEDYVSASLNSQLNLERNSKDGTGFQWMRNNRLSGFKDLSWITLMKYIYQNYMNPIIPRLQQVEKEMNYSRKYGK